MTESQQKVLGLLPKMGERFLKRFTFIKLSDTGADWFANVSPKAHWSGSQFLGLLSKTSSFTVSAPALIIEACRLIALEASCQLLDHGHCFECWHSVQREITPEFGYDPQDPFARAAAAMECVLSLPEGG
jgi:hypothetical protein